MSHVVCPYCDGHAKLVTGAVIYPGRYDLARDNFWHCEQCKAYVGCHRAGKGQGNGTTPLGRLANAELRRAKMAAHTAFDALWRSHRMSRSAAYLKLAERMGISVHKAHIGMFDVEQCKQVVAVAKELTQ